MPPNKNRWSILTKMKALTVLMTVLLVAVGGLSLWNLQRVSFWFKDIADIQFPAATAMGETDMMHDGLRAVALQAIIDSGSSSKEQQTAILAELSEKSESLISGLNQIEKLDVNPSTKKQIADSRADAEAYVKAVSIVVETGVAGKVDAAVQLVPAMDEKFRLLEEKFGQLSELIASDQKKSSDEGHRVVSEANRFSAIFVGISFILNLLLGIGLIRNLKGTLVSAIRDLSYESLGLEKTADCASQSSEGLSRSTEKQASALQETAASLEEITAMVKKTGENAELLEQTSGRSHQSATDGKNAIEQMLSAMDRISDANSKVLVQIEAGNVRISEIVKVIGEIGNKTNVINDIVFQTKLLSFNASVEAARAGEHGKGFAVVAEEVGNLARMSGSAAKEISDMLESSLLRVDSIVKENRAKIESLMDEGKSRLSQGSDVARQCGSALAEIVNQSDQVNRMTLEITTAIREQTQGIDEINKAMASLDQTTHENASLAEGNQESSRELLKQSENLAGIVESLQFLTLGVVQKSKFGTTESATLVHGASNVIPIEKLSSTKKLTHTQTSPTRDQRVAGSDIVPSSEDSRFGDL